MMNEKLQEVLADYKNRYERAKRQVSEIQEMKKNEVVALNVEFNLVSLTEERDLLKQFIDDLEYIGGN